jgi:hypothetical protein
VRALLQEYHFLRQLLEVLERFPACYTWKPAEVFFSPWLRDGCLAPKGIRDKKLSGVNFHLLLFFMIFDSYLPPLEPLLLNTLYEIGAEVLIECAHVPPFVRVFSLQSKLHACPPCVVELPVLLRHLIASLPVVENVCWIDFVFARA